MDKLEGDEAGIEALRALAADNKEFVKFLINDARTATDHAAPFTGKDGTKYLLRVDPAHGRIAIERAT